MLGNADGPVNVLCVVMAKLRAFEVASSQEGVLSSDLLGSACALWAELDPLSASAKDNLPAGQADTFEALQALVKRLRSILDEEGLEYIQGLIRSEKVSLDKVEAEARQVLRRPTPFLESCLLSCGVMPDVQNICKLDIGAVTSFAEVVVHMPVYVRLGSMNKAFMEKVSEENAAICESFRVSMEVKLTEVVAAFQRSLLCLKDLAEKYVQLCGISSSAALADDRCSVVAVYNSQ